MRQLPKSRPTIYSSDFLEQFKSVFFKQLKIIYQ
jgi:hypothetical protein